MAVYLQLHFRIVRDHDIRPVRANLIEDRAIVRVRADPRAVQMLAHVLLVGPAGIDDDPDLPTIDTREIVEPGDISTPRNRGLAARGIRYRERALGLPLRGYGNSAHRHIEVVVTQVVQQ